MQPAEMEGKTSLRPCREQKSVLILLQDRKKRLTGERVDRMMLFAPAICLPLDVRSVSFLRVRMPEYMRSSGVGSL